METKVLTRLGKSMAILTISSLTTHAIQAQSLVRGQVTDTKGEPLMGATIKVKNSQEGAITDLDGKFSFESKRTLTAKDRLEVKYVGFKTQEIEYSNKVLQVLLEEDAEEINEVVVTALGIKRDEKGLGYATTKVEGSQITGTMPANWSSALTGKVAGLSIISSGGPLSTSRISVRGDVSLNANGNNALVVVDGVPLSSPMTNPGMAYGAGDAAELGRLRQWFLRLESGRHRKYPGIERSQCHSLVRFTRSKRRHHGNHQIGSQCQKGAWRFL